jgi:hypothetical protein
MLGEKRNTIRYGLKGALSDISGVIEYLKIKVIILAGGVSCDNTDEFYANWLRKRV